MSAEAAAHPTTTKIESITSMELFEEVGGQAGSAILAGGNVPDTNRVVGRGGGSFNYSALNDVPGVANGTVYAVHVGVGDPTIVVNVKRVVGEAYHVLDFKAACDGCTTMTLQLDGGCPLIGKAGAGTSKGLATWTTTGSHSLNDDFQMWYAPTAVPSPNFFSVDYTATGTSFPHVASGQVKFIVRNPIAVPVAVAHIHTVNQDSASDTFDFSSLARLLDLVHIIDMEFPTIGRLLDSSGVVDLNQNTAYASNFLFTYEYVPGEAYDWSFWYMLERRGAHSNVAKFTLSVPRNVPSVPEPYSAPLFAEETTGNTITLEGGDSWPGRKGVITSLPLSKRGWLSTGGVPITQVPFELNGRTVEYNAPSDVPGAMFHETSPFATFKYKVASSTALSDEGEVRVTVSASNDPPFGSPASVSVSTVGGVETHCFTVLGWDLDHTDDELKAFISTPLQYVSGNTTDEVLGVLTKRDGTTLQQGSELKSNSHGEFEVCFTPQGGISYNTMFMYQVKDSGRNDDPSLWSAENRVNISVAAQLPVPKSLPDVVAFEIPINAENPEPEVISLQHEEWNHQPLLGVIESVPEENHGMLRDPISGVWIHERHQLSGLQVQYWAPDDNPQALFGLDFAQFTFSVVTNDLFLSSEPNKNGVVTIEVRNVNDAPVGKDRLHLVPTGERPFWFTLDVEDEDAGDTLNDLEVKVVPQVSPRGDLWTYVSDDPTAGKKVIDKVPLYNEDGHMEFRLWYQPWPEVYNWTFDYSVRDQTLIKESQPGSLNSVTLFVGFDNEPPFTEEIVVITDEDEPVQFELNITDVDSRSFEAFLISTPSRGQLKLPNGLGNFSNVDFACPGVLDIEMTPTSIGQCPRIERTDGKFLLVFEPAKDEYSFPGQDYAVFYFSAMDSDKVIGERTKVHIQVRSTPDIPILPEEEVTEVIKRQSFVPIVMSAGTTDKDTLDFIIPFSPALGNLYVGDSQLYAYPALVTGKKVVEEEADEGAIDGQLTHWSAVVEFHPAQDGASYPYSNVTYYATDRNTGVRTETKSIFLRIECDQSARHKANVFDVPGDVCTLCPEGAVCSDDGSSIPTNDDGYWELPNQPYVYVPCSPTAACPKGTPGEPTKCGEGYEGLRCGNCATGYHQRNDGCVPCPKDSAFVFYFGISALLVCVLGALLLWLYMGRPSLAFAGIVITYFQTLAIFSKLRDLWGEDLNLSNIFQNLGIFNLDLTVVAIGCNMNFHFRFRYMLFMSLPLVIIGLLALSLISWFVFELVFKKDEEAGSLWAHATEKKKKKGGFQLDSSEEETSDSEVEVAKKPSLAESRRMSSLQMLFSASAISRSERLAFQFIKRTNVVKKEKKEAEETWLHPALRKARAQEEVERKIAAAPTLSPWIQHALKRRAAVSRVCVRIHHAFTLFVYATVMFLNVAYITMTSQAIELFDCTKNPDGSYTLDAQPSLSCYEQWWFEIMPLGIVGIVCYMIGVPLLLSWFIFKKRMDVLTIKFIDAFFYWELLVMARKLLLVVSRTMATSFPMLQASFTMSVLFIAVLMQNKYLPYKRYGDLNLLESLTLLACCLILLCGLIVYGEDRLSSSQRMGLAILGLCFVAFATLAIVFFTLRIVWRSLVSKILNSDFWQEKGRLPRSMRELFTKLRIPEMHLVYFEKARVETYMLSFMTEDEMKQMLDEESFRNRLRGWASEHVDDIRELIRLTKEEKARKKKEQEEKEEEERKKNAQTNEPTTEAPTSPSGVVAETTPEETNETETTTTTTQPTPEEVAAAEAEKKKKKKKRKRRRRKRPVKEDMGELFWDADLPMKMVTPFVEEGLTGPDLYYMSMEELGALLPHKESLKKLLMYLNTHCEKKKK